MSSEVVGWRETLQSFLDRLGWKQADFVAETDRTYLRRSKRGSKRVLSLSRHTVSTYLRDRDPRLPKHRDRYIDLVDFFAITGVIRNADEANEWLRTVGYSLLETEIEEIFNVRGTIEISSNELPPRIFREILDALRQRFPNLDLRGESILIRPSDLPK